MIAELNANEIDQVDGGVLGCLVVAVIVVGAAIYVGYQAEHNSDNQNESTK